MYLTAETKRILEQSMGITIEELSKMNFEEEKVFVERKIGHKLAFSRNCHPKMIGRGNPLLAYHRICTMEEIDRKIEEL